MRKLFVTGIILFIANIAIGQNLETLKLETTKMFTATSKMNYDEILDYSYQKLFGQE